MTGRRILFVNACVNCGTSRTMRLAGELLSRFRDDDVEELHMEAMGLGPLSSETVVRRARLASEGRFDDPVFDLPRMLASADIVVLATPFWESSYSSYAKLFLEHSAAIGVTFRYAEDGSAVGMCRARALYYVTTRGGPVGDYDDLGYRNVRDLARTYGIKECIAVSACGLDMPGADVDSLLADAASRIPEAP